MRPATATTSAVGGDSGGDAPAKSRSSPNQHSSGSSPKSSDQRQQKQREVAEGFLMSSCAGQFGLVLEDLRKLLPPTLLTDSFVRKVAKSYHSQQGKIVEGSDGHKVLLHERGEVGEDGYMDPRTKQVLTVDHLTGKVLSAEQAMGKGPKLMDATLEKERTEIAEAVAKYVTTHYATESAASAVYAWTGTLYIVIYGERLNLRNFWSGSWLSVWEIKDGDISGTIKTRAHYFEEGNMQAQVHKVVAATALPASEGAAPGSIAAAAISKAEAKVQRGLEAMFQSLSNEGFRSLLNSVRRRLPMTKQKMDWGGIVIHKLNKTLGNSSTSSK